MILGLMTAVLNRTVRQPARDAGRNEPLGPLPASVRSMAKARPFGVVSPPIGVFPLRCADGRTFAERKAQENAA